MKKTYKHPISPLLKSLIIGFMGCFMAVTLPIKNGDAMQLTCAVTQPPVINIRPQTKQIQYDFKKTSAQLSRLKTDTVSPYGMNPDQTTGGLRQDRPIMETEIEYHVLQNQLSQTSCLSYSTINVSILLQPKIFIAKEFNHGRCRQEVIIHEKKHVETDRKIMNKYTKIMGYAIQTAVNNMGVTGPFPTRQLPHVQQKMGQAIENAIAQVQPALNAEMRREQQKIDSREEYDRISAHCQHAAEKIYKQRNRQR